ncbi:MAG: 3,4-dihydroxyphenylacetate 2,3-dioxygenase [Saccharolobus sp.]|jgi:catechol 2,3-dioxygenase|uniref:3,4-dihydroxyphenylacetate 2,3-dioxygenase n=1 Tax=Saccharolobus sp. TaxID=2100761 RepID=UPI0028CF9FCF|nr:3,4-dihydroxyphenylacetate 2,3-dioxygenase [Saccharolobus sp.]MDT7861838.1 3,4-dihydroxyphenylacetate 2,3-dioxygenase [Saccharolobus sp.]
MINVLRLSHVCIRVTDLDKAKYFYVDLLGLVETERDGDYIYLRGIEEGQHHSLILKKANSPGLSYIGFRVANEKELDKAEEELKQLGLKIVKFREKAVNEGLLFETPQGIPIFLYYDMEYVGDLRLAFDKHRGVSPVRLAHVNYIVNDLEKETEFLKNYFGYYVTETYLDKNGNKSVIWLTKRGDSHEIAIAKSNRNYPGYHHQTYYVHDVKDIIRAADIMASVGLWDSIERGPGRHGATEGYYIYLRDFDKNRIEFFTNDYVVLDPDKWKPIIWTYEQFRYRSDFWGRPIPQSWLEEWVPVEDISTGKLKW